jgi:hypothetical protein
MESVVAALGLRFRPELMQEAWASLQAGEFLTQAGERIGLSRTSVRSGS